MHYGIGRGSGKCMRLALAYGERFFLLKTEDRRLKTRRLPEQLAHPRPAAFLRRDQR